MDNKTRKYLKILRIELEDLISDLEFSEEVLAKRFKEHEITEYVFLENISLLKKEVLGVEKLKRVIEKADGEKRSITELRSIITEYFQTEIKAAGLPSVVMLLVNRKLDKVIKYIQLEEE